MLLTIEEYNESLYLRAAQEIILLKEYLNENDDLETEDDEDLKNFLNYFSRFSAVEETAEYLENDFLNEGLLGSVIGAAGGFTFGKKIGKVIANVLGIEKGALYDLLTSRVVATAMGYELGKRI